MPVVGGIDIHRAQLTFDYVDLDTGEVVRGRIAPADREQLRPWLDRFAGRPEVAFALEGCTGWRYVVEELQRAGVDAHVAEPAETAARRGPKRRAKTDRSDARLLRELLTEGRIPESWIPPQPVLEARALVRLYKDLLDERTGWLQRVHASLFHMGVPDWTSPRCRRPGGSASPRRSCPRPPAPPSMSGCARSTGSPRR